MLLYMSGALPELCHVDKDDNAVNAGFEVTETCKQRLLQVTDLDSAFYDTKRCEFPDVQPSVSTCRQLQWHVDASDEDQSVFQTQTAAQLRAEFTELRNAGRAVSGSQMACAQHVRNETDPNNCRGCVVKDLPGVSADRVPELSYAAITQACHFLFPPSGRESEVLFWIHRQTAQRIFPLSEIESPVSSLFLHWPVPG